MKNEVEFPNVQFNDKFTISLFAKSADIKFIKIFEPSHKRFISIKEIDYVDNETFIQRVFSHQVKPIRTNEYDTIAEIQKAGGIHIDYLVNEKGGMNTKFFPLTSIASVDLIEEGTKLIITTKGCYKFGLRVGNFKDFHDLILKFFNGDLNVDSNPYYITS